MSHYGTCFYCGAPLEPGNAPFTRECEDCGTVYAADTEESITAEELLALLEIDPVTIQPYALFDAWSQGKGYAR
jgi:hypothetical protein